MAEQFSQLSEAHRAFIAEQHIYFVGTAAATGRVNVSPKGTDSLRVLAPDRLVWLNLTGSGNETAAHLVQHPRMTVMFCSFERQPLILRLYGNARAVHPRDPDWHELIECFGVRPGARQCFVLDIDLVQTSCGFAVPLLDFKDDRRTLDRWAEKAGADGLQAYWSSHNVQSLDGFPTGIETDSEHA